MLLDFLFLISIGLIIHHFAFKFLMFFADAIVDNLKKRKD